MSSELNRIRKMPSAQYWECGLSSPELAQKGCGLPITTSSKNRHHFYLGLGISAAQQGPPEGLVFFCTQEPPPSPPRVDCLKVGKHLDWSREALCLPDSALHSSRWRGRWAERAFLTDRFGPDRCGHAHPHSQYLFVVEDSQLKADHCFGRIQEGFVGTEFPTKY